MMKLLVGNCPTKFQTSQIHATSASHCSALLADLQNQPIGSLCVTHILQFCGYIKGQDQICFNTTSWHLVTYNFL